MLNAVITEPQVAVLKETPAQEEKAPIGEQKQSQSHEQDVNLIDISETIQPQTSPVPPVDLMPLEQGEKIVPVSEVLTPEEALAKLVNNLHQSTPQEEADEERLTSSEKAALKHLFSPQRSPQHQPPPESEDTNESDIDMPSIVTEQAEIVVKASDGQHFEHLFLYTQIIYRRQRSGESSGDFTRRHLHGNGLGNGIRAPRRVHHGVSNKRRHIDSKWRRDATHCAPGLVSITVLFIMKTMRSERVNA